MDDLSSIPWSVPGTSGSSRSNANTSFAGGMQYPTLRPTPPLSGRSTPLGNLGGLPIPGQRTASETQAGSKSSTPLKDDSFANLVSFNASQPTRSVSLQEQQRRLQQEKEAREVARRQQSDTHFGAGTSTLTSRLSGSTSMSAHGAQTFPTLQGPTQSLSTHQGSTANVRDDADLLSAFDASAPVDMSSHMQPVSRTEKNIAPSRSVSANADMPNSSVLPANDDDPFGLGPMSKPLPMINKAAPRVEDNDDVLGMLSRPVSEFPKSSQISKSSTGPGRVDNQGPIDRAMAELLDMGFSAEKSKAALQSTGSGTDVQAAVGYILNQAHEESRKSKRPNGHRRRSSSMTDATLKSPNRRKSSGGTSGQTPAWMKEPGRNTAKQQKQQDELRTTRTDKVPAQIASDLGSTLFKSANSLWKTGAKKLNQAVAELNAETDSAQPKWMQDGLGEKPKQSHAQARAVEKGQPANDTSFTTDSRSRHIPRVTDEALLLEGEGSRPQRKQSNRDQNPRGNTLANGSSVLPIRLSGTPPGIAQGLELRNEHGTRDPRSRVSRQTVEDEAAKAYISPARRKRPAAKAMSVEPEIDLLPIEDSKPFKPAIPSANTNTSNSASPQKYAGGITRQRPPRRAIPLISQIALQQSNAERRTGSECFKRGDYAQATVHYTTALSVVPVSHPVILPILTNRALSHLKTGHPKSCIEDAKSALDFIGPLRGADETVELGADEGDKMMTTYWGKAVTRQAEAYEQLERWSEAAASWRLCVEAGLGGSTSIAGRNRCESASRPATIKATTQRSSPVKKSTAAPASAMSELNPSHNQTAQSREAVSKLRAANALAERIDDEKFALSDQVDARIAQWRNGKEGNLRALLSSLETVLWAEAGWKKVGMGDVLIPGKVKIIYMKGIAKVHPDKLPTTATTEQKMISAAVFATLNEAWEKFKTENGL